MRKYAFCATAVLLLATSAHAALIYAPNALPRPYPFDGPDELIMFDSSDPAGFTIVGSMSVPNIGFGGMDFDRDGNLWAYASLYKPTNGAAAGLYSVDLNTGAATVQGTLSTQPLDDLAFNPTDNQMYGIRSQFNTTRLYTVNLVTGTTSYVGNFSGLPADVQLTIGLAIDSEGDFYVHDVGEDKIYKCGAGLALTELYALSQDTGFSQGMGIDWSRDDMGYHGAVGQGVFPDYFSQVNTFAPDGSAYTLGPDFGPNEYYGGYGFPLVEPGDLAVMPVPEPTSVLLLALGVLLCRRR